ncbi:MAG: thiamine pyrophosphate-dependent dehydrogenase E1 component subunit alpha [Synergistaceae bacterium]|nr:thiamine pyrophosphate-dependent dehydrogenase E1 component subunit alpha [Synergistaceae bacterium]
MGDKIVEYILGGRISGAIHPSLGQEAISAGILLAVEMSGLDVYVHCTHRQQPLIAKIIGNDPFLGELMNKRTGLLHGCSGEYHLVSLKDKLLPMCGILGAGLLSSTGYAWTIKDKGLKDTVALCSIGDGAMSQGSVYEGMNLASILKLPILYVIENNGVAMTTPVKEQAPIADLYLRAEASGMRGCSVDGNDVEAVIEALLEGLKLAENNEPNVIELKTWRWHGHYVGDDQSAYRDTSFLNNLDALDPVKRYEKKLLERGVATDALFEKVWAEQKKILSEAFERAVAAEHPSREEVLDYNCLYSNDAGGAI